MKTADIIEYIFGFEGHSGIPTITGDAGVWSAALRVLDLNEIRDVATAYLDKELGVDKGGYDVDELTDMREQLANNLARIRCRHARLVHTERIRRTRKH